LRSYRRGASGTNSAPYSFAACARAADGDCAGGFGCEDGSVGCAGEVERAGRVDLLRTDGKGEAWGCTDVADEADGLGALFGGGDLVDGHASDALDLDVLEGDIGAKGVVGEDDELDGGVDAVDVVAGVGFGVAQARGFGEGVFVAAGVWAVHRGEDEVGGAVEDAIDGQEAVAHGQGAGHGEEGGAGADGGAVAELDILGGGVLDEVGHREAQWGLGGSDGVLSGIERGAELGDCGFRGGDRTGDGLEDCVGLGLGDEAGGVVCVEAAAHGGQAGAHFGGEEFLGGEARAEDGRGGVCDADDGNVEVELAAQAVPRAVDEHGEGSSDCPEADDQHSHARFLRPGSGELASTTSRSWRNGIIVPETPHARNEHDEDGNAQYSDG